MNKWLKRTLITVWLVVFPFVFARIWLTTSALSFINLPESVWIFLVEFFYITCCEGGADLEIVVGLFFGFVFALILLGLFLLVRKWWYSR